MVGKSVSCRCSYCKEKTDDEIAYTCGVGVCEKKCHIPSFQCVLLHKYPYILFVNLILGIIMYYDMILFFINNPRYISFITVNDEIRNFFLLLPFLIVFLGYIICRIGKLILYHRTVNAMCLVWAEEYFDEEDKNGITRAFNHLAEVIRQLFSPQQERKKEIQKILENMPSDCDERNKCSFIIRELRNESKIRVINGSKNLMRISFAENRYNKILLNHAVTKIIRKEQNFSKNEEIITEDREI